MGLECARTPYRNIKASPSPSGEGLGWGLSGDFLLPNKPHPSAAARLLPSPEGEGL
jgi:hypothetical protein